MKAEAEYAKQKIQAVPEVVSTESTIHNVTSETATPPPEEDVDMMEGIRNDFVRLIPFCMVISPNA